MKQYFAKARFFSGLIFLSFSGCVVPNYTAIMRNISALPVRVRLDGLASEWPSATNYERLRYLSETFSPTWSKVDKMNDSLAVVRTAKTMEFLLPAHSTVRLGSFRDNHPFSRFTLQKTGSPIEVLDSTAIIQAVHRKGYIVWFDVK